MGLVVVRVQGVDGVVREMVIDSVVNPLGDTEFYPVYKLSTGAIGAAGQIVSPTNPLPIEVKGPLTSFGEVFVAEPTPIVQLQFPYNINTRLILTKENNGGTVVQSNDHAVISTGASATSRAILESKTAVKYNTGQGVNNKFTALFTVGKAGSFQGAGIGDESDGFFFGYDETSFGVLRRRGGSPEVRTLTVATASSTAEDVTITLDGVVSVDVTVTNSNDTAVTAKEIADHDYGSVGNGWIASAVGNTVIFISFDAAAKTGSFTLSGAATAVGTFAQTTAGVDSTDTWIPQASWNGDVMDGTGISGQDLDPTKGNVYQIQFQWLGYGLITFSIEDQMTGHFIMVHRLQYGNTNTETSISNPTLPLCVFAINTLNTTDIVVKSASLAGFVEGKEALLGIPLSAGNLFAIGNVTSEEPILTIRVKDVYQGRINRVKIVPVELTLVSNLAANNSNTTFRTYIGAIPTNGVSYSDVDSANSVVESDIDAEDFLDGELQTTFILAKEETKMIDLSLIEDIIRPGTIFMVTAQASKGNASNEVGASINWKELF